MTSRYPIPDDGMAYLLFRTTPRDRWLLAMLAEHRLLTAAQIQALCFTGTRTMNARLTQLHALGLIDRFRDLTGADRAGQCYRYVLGPRGAMLAAAAHDLTAKQIGYDHAKVLRQGARADLPHTIGTRDALVALAARRRLAAWWDEYTCMPAWGDLIRPDAYGVYQEQGTGGFGFFYEYDTGSEHLAQLTAKTRGYARFAAAYCGHRPILIHLTDTAREATLHARLADHPEAAGLPIATVVTAPGERTAEQIAEHGACLDGPTWWILGTAGRARLADLPARLASSGVNLLPIGPHDPAVRAPSPRPPRVNP